VVALDDMLVHDITDRARQIQFSRVLLTVLAGTFYALGWITARTFGVIWLAMTWTAVAVKVGWTEGRRKPPPRR
jgi:hypothetical protein